VEGVGDGVAGGAPRLTLEHDEAPRRELAVIRDPRGDGEQRIDLGRRRAWTGQFHRLERAPGFQKFEGIRH